MMTPSICTGDIALRTRSSIIRLDKWPCIRCCIFRKGKNAGLFPSISNTPNRRSFFVIPTIEAPLVTRSWSGSGGSLIPCGDGKSLQRKWQSENQWKCLYHQPSRRKCRYNGAAKRKTPVSNCREAHHLTVDPRHVALARSNAAGSGDPVCHRNSLSCFTTPRFCGAKKFVMQRKSPLDT